MNPDQRRFYDDWALACERSEFRPIDGNISYVFCYTYELLRQPSLHAVEQLTKIREIYQPRCLSEYEYVCEDEDGKRTVWRNSLSEIKIKQYCGIWISDLHVALGDLKTALEVFPEIRLGILSRSQSNKFLSLKYHLGLEVSGQELLPHIRPHLTPWGRTYRNEVATTLDVVLREQQDRTGTKLLKEWVKISPHAPYKVFDLAPVRPKSQIRTRMFRFDESSEVKTQVRSLTREAENLLRKNLGIPEIGQGWLAETELYLGIKRNFPNHEVIHHAMPDWLKPQHLDILLPGLNLAIEFQGEQHYQPVARFGGRRALSSVRLRDNRKRRLCRKNGLRLLEVRSGYSLPKLLKEIRLRGL